MNSKFYINKRKSVIEKMQDNSILVMFSGVSPFQNADAHYEFRVNSNFFYLTGINEEGLALLISKVNNEVIETLFIKRRDPVLVKWVGENIQEEEACRISGITTINYVDNLEKIITYHLFMNGVKNVYLDIERHLNNANDFEKRDFTVKLKNDYPHINIENIYPIIAKMRTIKSNEEIDEIKEAIHITNLGLQHAMKNMKAGMKEYEMEAYYDFGVKSNGCKVPAFTTIAAGGKRAVVLHYVANDGVVNDKELIMFDLGARSKNNYCADISRTYPVNGKFTPRQKELYNIVLKAHDVVIENIKPGISIAQLNDIVIDTYEVELKRIGLIKDRSEVKNYYYHSVSHMLGIDTHDIGYNRNDPLQENMVLTVEPGLYIEQEGIGIRIEDDVLVTKTGCINLSSEIINKADEIEAFMKK
jgi:Xaa-Pro aminopeptidase